ncbi:MAG: hypothetical protein RL553_2307 [Planctomycetota bacterium]|jgi:death-on-curing protein
MSPDFLTLEEVLEIHDDQINRYGGASGIRDLGLLESALAQPQTVFGKVFLHSDLFEMAAAYFFHIIQNHPFMDGNKRVGAVAALVFLEINNKAVIMTNDELESQVLSVAQGLTDKTASAKFFREHVV